MSSHERMGSHAGTSAPGDELDRLLSRGVHDLAGNTSPSPRVWQQIEKQLRAGPSLAQHRAKRRHRRSASLAQALALASLLVVVGLSLGPVLLQPPYLYGDSKPADLLTRTPDAEITQDSIPFLAEEGLLSGRVVLLMEREQAMERQVMARDTSPSEDPILRHGLKWRSAHTGH